MHPEKPCLYNAKLIRELQGTVSDRTVVWAISTQAPVLDSKGASLWALTVCRIKKEIRLWLKSSALISVRPTRASPSWKAESREFWIMRKAPTRRRPSSRLLTMVKSSWVCQPSAKP
ncbi:protein of unknown function [Candidatus Filomicrobium marinum]|uniref:Uncharacterized protein n=1 Tax=Candidatus Filomicrobium marinum TaxID=1608628 RepID=A0A0D6JCV7_9HYPH|nr:protein of unknown function [Candidatus Filomicrobium marinum]